jgi:Iron-dependent Transcriptional regulator
LLLRLETADMPECIRRVLGGFMQITRTADYGVRLMTLLALPALGTRMTVADLAEQSGASVAFVGKILQRLVRARLAVSHRGYEGGFERLPRGWTGLRPRPRLRRAGGMEERAGRACRGARRGDARSNGERHGQTHTVESAAFGSGGSCRLSRDV